MDAKTLVFKKRQRSALQLNCNKETAKAKDYLAENSDVKTSDLEVSIAKITDYRVKLNSLNNEIILEIEDDNEGTVEMQTATDLDDQLLELSTLLQSKLKLIEESSIAESDQAYGSTHSIASPRSATVRLPKLEIAKYSGDALKWQEFWDSFSSTIHVNPQLSQIDKFKYLHTFLDGDALRVVQGYLLTAENYETVIEYLKERFGNPQVAIFSHLEAMLSLPIASHETQKLQRTFDECERHIRSLIALGLPEDTFGQVFTPIILSKLPLYVKMELHRRNGSKMWTLQNLRETLKDEIMARNLSSAGFGAKPEETKPKNSGEKRGEKFQGKQHQKGNGSSASLLADGTSKPNKQSPRCSFCSDNHYSDDCKKYPDLTSRRDNLKGRCFKCLSSKHVVKKCEVKFKCVHCNSDRHHRALCPVKFGGNDTSTAACLGESSEDAFDDTPVNSTLLSHNERVILQTSFTKIKGKKTENARLLFDTGCSRTFITSQMSKQIGARPAGEEVVSIAGFAATKRKTIKYPIVEFDVLLLDGSVLTLTANVISTISCPVQRYPIDVKKHPIVKQLKLAEPICDKKEMVNIDVLIGNDYYYDIVDSERIRCPDGPILLASKVGFIATGRVDLPNSNAKTKTTVASLFLGEADVNVDNDATFQVEKFWSLEDIGIKTPTSKNEDDDALQNFNATVKFKEGRYAVKWPWKDDAPELPENYYLAQGRLKSLMKRLKQDEKLLQTYDQTIKDQETKGVIEKVDQLESQHKVHYIPHHCVVTPGKATTKVRVVYDASAKQNKSAPSLNECMLRGPVILEDLCGLLMRFRMNKIALVSDIEKAFLQVALQDDSRDVTRFLWLKDLTKPAVGENIVVYRFCRVAFGIIASMFLLAASVLYHLAKYTSATAIDIRDSMYVDNVINGKQTVDEAKNFYFEAKQIFADASMNLREWFTNSPEVTAIIAQKDRGKTVETKVLGMLWNTERDVLSCSSFKVQAESVNTKRLMLKYLAKVFDPCGYFSAVTVAGKLLIQKLWQEKFDWDDILPADFVQQWMNISNSLEDLANHKIKRCISVEESGVSEFALHCFCDASAKAYSAVVYLLEFKNGVPKNSNIIFAKSRVAPVKTITIPRLELLAMLIGTRLITFVETQLRIPIAEKWVWSDSQCVLHWLVKQDISTLFVKNRIKEIKSHDGIKFRYVPTQLNPADISSRGCTYGQVKQCQIWWNGPEYLLKHKNGWPPGIQTKEIEQEEFDDSGTKCANMKSTEQPVLLAIDEHFRLKPENFSSLKRLQRVTAWVRRFINNARKKTQCVGGLSAEEIMEANEYWEKTIQLQHFGLIDNSNINEFRRKYKQLDVFVDPVGLIRCGGRLKYAEIDDAAKQPILLPKNNAFTDLVIVENHQNVLHDGVAHTLAQIRTKYWIIHGRPQLTRIIRSCRVCKLKFGGPFKLPKFPPLPDFRVSRQKPFGTVGIDYLGPLKYKAGKSGEQRKVWICLFTCTAIRAIHLEVVQELSTEQFLLCLRRFMAKCGTPTMIISDNAKHFKTANQTLSKIWNAIQNNADIQGFVANRSIKWKFITEFAPWMGGFYERLVGIVKRTLKCSLDSRCVSLLELQTVVAEAAGIINSRPLLYSEADNSDTPITPGHFIGSSCCSFLSLPNTPDDSYKSSVFKSDELLQCYQKQQKLLDSFWVTWKNQYLTALRENANFHKQRNTSDTEPKVRSVVLLKENAPRCTWKLGIIVELKSSSDGYIRSAAVRVANGKTFNRPLKLLFPLELSAELPQATDDNTEVRQNKRAAAKMATQRIKQLMEANNDVEAIDN